METVTIKELDQKLIHAANYNSFNGNRGTLSNNDYMAYCNTINEWNISDEKKQKLLDQLYKKWSEKLSFEARHVSVMVAGPAKYNSKRLDHGDKVLELSSNIYTWFKELEKQIKLNSSNDDEKERKINRALDMINWCVNNKWNPNNDLIKLALLDSSKFIEMFEKLNPVYKWRKNSNIYKLYEKAKNGEVTEIQKIMIFEDENLSAYTEGDRAYLKFILKPQRQLIVALKSRGWFWNAYKSAWSTYLNKVDKEWIESISERYSKYL